ncbi:MAG: zinc ribbon domain-containing protein [Gemmataceae bacterium]
MRCPQCQTSLTAPATTCPSCGAALEARPAKARRRKGENGDANAAKVEAYNRRVLEIWRTCLWSAVPLVGLILGPLGAVRAWQLLRSGRNDPDFQAQRAAVIAMRLGLITGVSNWLGLALMVVGPLLGSGE